MRFQWARNFIGQALGDDQMRIIKYPLFELACHVTIKTVQTFAIVTMVAIGPAVCAIRGPRNLSTLLKTAVKYSKFGTIAGVVVGPFLTYARLRGGDIDDDGLFDRCYRLRYNRNQVRTDRFCFLGTVGGLALVTAMGGNLSSGAVIGLVGGTILGGLYNSVVVKNHV